VDASWPRPGFNQGAAWRELVAAGAMLPAMSTIHVRLTTTAAAIAAVALVPAASARAAPTFEFQPGPSSPFGNALAADANGDAWLATYRSGVPGKVLVSVRRADGSVRRLTTYTAPAGYATLNPKIAARDGRATVAFSQSKGSSGIRAMAIRCTSSACGRALQVGRGQRVETEATPVVDELGRSFVFWRGTSSRGPRLQWALTANGRFRKARTLGRFGSDLTAIADPRGGEELAWVESDATVAVARRKSGEVAAPQHLSTGRASDPQLVAGGPEVFAAWRDGAGDGEGQPGAGAVHAAIRGAGRSDFGSAQTIFTGSGRDPMLAADGDGRAALAFADAGARPDATFLGTSEVAVRQPGGAFGAPLALGPGPLFSAPAVTVAGGRVIGAWASQADLQQPVRIEAAELGAAGPGVPVDLGPGSAPLAGGAVIAWTGPSSYLGFAIVP
jgi:hypothetical protein